MLGAPPPVWRPSAPLQSTNDIPSPANSPAGAASVEGERLPGLAGGAGRAGAAKEGPAFGGFDPGFVPLSELDDQDDELARLQLPEGGSEGEEDVGPAGSDDGEGSGSYGEMLQRLRWLMMMRSGEGGPLALPPPVVRPPVLSSFDLAGVAEYIRSGRAARVVVMCGAGLSVSAGIPDFRSPGSGLYHRLQDYDLPYPQAVFEMDFFRQNPRPFYLLAKELFPGNFAPTPAHYFLRLLHDKGLLLRCFTQNIDSLEHQAGLPYSAVVAAHGNFDAAACIECGRQHSVEHVRRAVFAGDGNPCFCKECGGLCKPRIIFFGESLPARFFQCAREDLPRADLLIVMGTSLVVQPFASLIDHVGEGTPRLLVNRERAGEADPLLRLLGHDAGGFCFDGQGCYRDALFLGDCDDGVRQLCDLLGWRAELEALVAAGPQPAQPEVEAGQPPPRRWWRVLPGAGSRRERRVGELRAVHRMLQRARQRRQASEAAGQAQQQRGQA